MTQVSNLFLDTYLSFRHRYGLANKDALILARLIRFSNDGTLMPKEEWNRWNQVGIIVNKKVTIPSGMVVMENEKKTTMVFSTFWMKCLLLYRGIMKIEEDKEQRRIRIV